MCTRISPRHSRRRAPSEQRVPGPPTSRRRRCTRCRRTPRCSRCASCWRTARAMARCVGRCHERVARRWRCHEPAARRRAMRSALVTTLRVCALYPDLMNIYADRGNLLLLERRCDWRGIGFVLSSSAIGDELDPDSADLFYIGGGQDRDQELCAHDMAELKRAALHEVADRGAMIFAVCGGYQLLGESYQLGERMLPGVGIVDLRTVREDGPRLIGNAAIEVTLTAGERRTIAGFENHGGRTIL